MEQASEQPVQDSQEQTPETSPKKKMSNRAKITWIVVAAVVVVAAVGFLIWHDQPSFCDAFCHNPQDPYNPTFYAEPGEAAVDKWGNEVEDASGMYAAVHREAGLTCTSCHASVLSQQVAEGIKWLTGNYYNPLSERSLSDLMSVREGMTDEEFCLNESCHNLTLSELTEETSYLSRNPHAWHHFEYTCSDCHKSHRASIMVCSECHEDSVIPDGWLTVEEARNLETIYGSYDDEEE